MDCRENGTGREREIRGAEQTCRLSLSMVWVCVVRAKRGSVFNAKAMRVLSDTGDGGTR